MIWKGGKADWGEEQNNRARLAELVVSCIARYGYSSWNATLTILIFYQSTITVQVALPELLKIFGIRNENLYLELCQCFSGRGEGIVAIELGYIIRADLFRADCLALVLVSTVAKSFIIHLSD